MSAHEFHVELPPARLEIRCCCDPTRLYGWLTLNGEPVLGQRLRFAVPPTRITDGPADVGTVTPGGEVLLSVDRLTVPREEGVRGFGDFRSYWALKYEGDGPTFAQKLEALRHVPGFEPSPEAVAVLGGASS